MLDKLQSRKKAPPDDPLNLERSYGKFMRRAEVARELKFTSPAALRMARQRGALKLQAIKVPGRREHLYLTNEVAAVLIEWMSHASEEIPM